MQNFRHVKTALACFTLLSLTLVGHQVFGNENKVSYLDSVSSSYLYNQPTNDKAIMNANSSDAMGFEASFKLDSKPVITNSDAKVNLSLRESDVKQVLRMLADKAGINLVLDKSVQGKITVDLNNINVNDAFLVVFKTMQFTYAMDNNTLTVMTLDASKQLGYTRQNMTVLPIKYVNANSVADFLNNNLFKSNIFGLSNQPIVTSNPRTNQIVVFGTSNDVMAIKRILPVIDTKPLINEFKVNHTTPKEMANLICDSLFYNSGSTSSGKSSYSSNLTADEVTLGGGVLACRDQSESSSSSNSNNLAAFKTNPLSVTYFQDLGKIATYGGSVEQVEIIKEFIKQHDQKQLMAYIELSVIELNESGSKEFSNEWNLWTPFISLGFNPSDGLTTNSNNPFFIWGNKYPVETTYAKYGDDGTSDHQTGVINDVTYVKSGNTKALVYRLKYLVENGSGRVLTNPKIMVTNGRKATIDMTSDYVKSVTSQVLQSSSSVTAATQKTYDIGSDEGLLIEIVPFISPDGYVSMNISPEFATIKERVYSLNDAGQQEISATLLQRRDIELKNVRIKDGETLVLAGLIKESETQTTQKMPVLSDLPVIGAFFRGNANVKSREELVIVVTPHIVKDTDADQGTYNL